VIVRALALDPEILLMDEPFAALDVQTTKMLYIELIDIHQETNKTILFVNHNITEAVALRDRVIVISPLLANMRNEFRVDLPRTRQLDHPLINSITKEIIEDQKICIVILFLNLLQKVLTIYVPVDLNMKLLPLSCLIRNAK
jgi:sulfonate transport system ATP-binding protein